MSNKPPH